MNTCCKENDCFDEYDRIAAAVRSKLDEDFGIKQALLLELADWLFEKESLHTDCLAPVIALLDGRNTDDV